MGKIKKPKPVKLICGLLGSDAVLFDQTCQILLRKFGPLDSRSQITKFDHTNYYHEEMGENLKRQFLSFSRTIDAGELSAIKTFTNRVEQKLSLNSKRRVNIDPGYVAASKLVLATIKNSSHRLYLGSGIYAEVTLHFFAGSFRPYEWTYPDYRSTETIEFFNRVRKSYLTTTSRG